jgi:hypothetical protein
MLIETRTVVRYRGLVIPIDLPKRATVKERQTLVQQAKRIVAFYDTFVYRPTLATSQDRAMFQSGGMQPPRDIRWAVWSTMLVRTEAATKKAIGR